MENNIDNTSISLGSFKSVSELKNAYDSLLSEFTRKCQLLKKLQSSLDATAQSGDSLSGGKDDNANTEPKVDEKLVLDRAIDLLDDDEFVSKYVCSNQFVKSKIIALYLKELLSRPKLPTPSQNDSVPVLTSFRSPKTLQEAKDLADKFLHDN